MTAAVPVSLRRSGLAALFARVGAMVLGLALTMMLARLLVPSQLAAYWVTLSALSFVVLLAQNGLGQVSISRISQASSRGEHALAASIASDSLAAAALASLVAAVIAAAAVRAFLPDSVEPWQISVFILVVGTVSGIYMQATDLLRARHRLVAAALLASQPASGGLITSGLLALGIALVWWINGWKSVELVQALCLFGLSWLIALVLAAACLSDPHQALKSKRAHGRDVAKLFRSALPVTASAGAMFIVTQADLWAMAHFRTAPETAIYGLAASLVKYVSAVNLLVGALLPGVVGHLYAKSELAALQRLLSKAALYGTGAAVVVFVSAVMAGDWLLEHAIGSAYRVALGPFLLLAVGHIVNAFLGYSNTVLVTAGRSAVLLQASVMASLVTLALLWWMTPAFGMLGAAAASCAGVVVYNATTWFLCGQTVGVWSDGAAALRLRWSSEWK